MTESTTLTSTERKKKKREKEEVASDGKVGNRWRSYKAKLCHFEFQVGTS